MGDEQKRLFRVVSACLSNSIFFARLVFSALIFAMDQDCSDGESGEGHVLLEVLTGAGLKLHGGRTKEGSDLMDLVRKLWKYQSSSRKI